MPLRSALPAVLGLTALVAAGCSGSRPRTAGPAPETRRPTVDYTVAETYEPTDVARDVATEAPAVQHDVPEALLTGRADADAAPRPPTTPPARPPSTPTGPARPVYRSQQGYRVQVFQSASKAEADAAVARAITWWRRARTGNPEVYTLYRAPYYRVRVGNYGSRGEAQRAIGALQGTFPNSFLVQDRVTVQVNPPSGD